MNRIQFERKKRKKSYLIPLVILVLLYFIIPIFLINRGSDLIKKSSAGISGKEVYAPSFEFYNGIAFLNTAAAFPGFGKWAENIQESSVEQIKKSQDSCFKKLCVKIIEGKVSDLEKIEVNYDKNASPPVLNLKRNIGDSISVKTLPLNDSILNYIDSAYCSQWIKFFERMKLDKNQLHSLCEK